MRAEYLFQPVVAGLFVAVLLTLPAFAQTSQNLSCAPIAVARIAGYADDNVLASLRGNIHPLALADYDEGRVDDNLHLEHIIMMLRRSPDQETALATRIDQMHKQRSAYYHQWLSAEDVGRCYGVADSDIAVVTDWLQRLDGLFKTTDGGTTFNATAAPDFCGSDGTANQCWYDMALAVAPNNANVVYGAGKYTYSTNAQTTVIRSTDDCKPVKRYGIHGCDPVRNGSCPKEYDWKGVCPPNPMMKAPCVLMCVPHRKEEKKGTASPKDQSPAGQVWIPEGKFEFVSASSHRRIFSPARNAPQNWSTI